VVLPFSFNFVYQIGADLAMTLLLIPTTIIQYIVMIPTYPLILNKSTRAKDSNEMNSFFRRYYLKLLAISLSISITSAVLIAYFIRPR
jgi:Cu/Ag efflux pump CusA